MHLATASDPGTQNVIANSMGQIGVLLFLLMLAAIVNGLKARRLWVRIVCWVAVLPLGGAALWAISEAARISP